jgi:ornithine cyclodeaminase
VEVVSTTAEVARSARLIVTCTAAREALLHANDLQPDTHVSAIGADTSGKQELEPAVLRRAALVLADSRRQCEKLGELQHTPDLWGRSVEIGDYCLHPRELPQEAVTVADFTGLGVEDLFIAEYAYERLTAHT